jgi:cyclopropane fatty-acyl-phospholipid synthase-like methyltransferase
MPGKNSHNAIRIERYYDQYGWIYPLIWGETIHWGLFPTGNETLEEAAFLWTERTISLLRPCLGGRFLEVGCGPARTSQRLLERCGGRIDALDISKYQLDRARGTNRDSVARGEMQLLQGDIAEAELAPASFDGAFSEAAFFHLFKKTRSIQNIRSALRPGAAFVFDDLLIPSSGYPDGVKRAYQRFGELELYSTGSYEQMLANAGFQLEQRIEAAADVRTTHLRLLGNLQKIHSAATTQLNEQLYRTLSNSFEEIVLLFERGDLDCQVFVAIAQ